MTGETTGTALGGVIARAFGAENRQRLLDRYFGQAETVDAAAAWRHVYTLLLWIDRTTALAHCYESDKAQPGRAWYARSLAFHGWVAGALLASPGDLGDRIDWLFREAVKDLSERAVSAHATKYPEQRAPYAGLGYPEPGEHPELAAIIREAVSAWTDVAPPETDLRSLTRRIYNYVSQENKRRNLVGEGFEDVLASLIRRLPVSNALSARSRAPLHEIGGFHRPSPAEKVKKVDLAVLAPARRILVSAKWSIRADREEQFLSDFESYSRLESAGEDFEYVLITNEFDAARLRAACERRRQNAHLFTKVVHINPQGIIAAYGRSESRSLAAVVGHLDTGRLVSLEQWLTELVGGRRTA